MVIYSINISSKRCSGVESKTVLGPAGPYDSDIVTAKMSISTALGAGRWKTFRGSTISSTRKCTPIHFEHAKGSKQTRDRTRSVLRTNKCLEQNRRRTVSLTSSVTKLLLIRVPMSSMSSMPAAGPIPICLAFMLVLISVATSSTITTPSVPFGLPRSAAATTSPPFSPAATTTTTSPTADTPTTNRPQVSAIVTHDHPHPSPPQIIEIHLSRRDSLFAPRAAHVSSHLLSFDSTSRELS